MHLVGRKQIALRQNRERARRFSGLMHTRGDRLMDLICYLIDDHPVDIRPARNRRQWMDETPDAYAYRCLPLSIANAHGWEARCPVTCEAEWNGGSAKDDIRI